MISAFVVRCLDSIIPILAIAEISRPKLVSAAEQAGLSLNGSQAPKTGFLVAWFTHMSWFTRRRMTKQTNWHVRPAKTQISLGIRPVWSESSLCAQRIAKDQSFLHADSEDSVQTWWMPRLIWVFAGRTCHFVGFVMHMLIIMYNKLPLTLRCTPRKYWLITQEALAPSRHDWKIVDWDVKPQHKQTNT